MTSFIAASHEGLIGFSVTFNFTRPISSDNLVSLSGPVITAEPERCKPLPEGKMHISMLDYLAVFINTWLSIKVLLIRGIPHSGWILRFLYENASKLDWMAHASRAHRPTIQNITHTAYAAMITFLSPSIFNVITEHVPGVNNNGADVFSCPYQFLTWSSVSLDLNPLTAYRIPVELLLHLHWIGSPPQTECILENVTTALLSGTDYFSNEAKHSGSQTSLSSSRHKRRCS